MNRPLLRLFACTIVVSTFTFASAAQHRGTSQSSSVLPGSQAVAPELLKANPWIESKTLADILARESSVEELRFMIGGLQSSVVSHGLNPHMGIQTGDCGDEDALKPTKMEYIQCSRLVGTQVTGQNDGSYLMEVYLEVAPSGGETKYLNIGAMAHDGMAPEETIRLKGNHYLHIVHGVEYKGTF
jgi:hypothetical protein